MSEKFLGTISAKGHPVMRVWGPEKLDIQETWERLQLILQKTEDARGIVFSPEFRVEVVNPEPEPLADYLARTGQSDPRNALLDADAKAGILTREGYEAGMVRPHIVNKETQ